MEKVWQCGYPICQHPGCWLANQDKSPKVPPLNRSIADAIEKSKKCDRVPGESSLTDSSLPTVKLIEVDSGIPAREPQPSPSKLPKAARTATKSVAIENIQQLSKTVNSPVQMILVELSKHNLNNCTYTPVYIWKPSSRSRRRRTLPETKERPQLKTVNLSEFLPPQTPNSTHKSKLKRNDIIDENVTELSEDMIKYLLSELVFDGNKASSGPVVMKPHDESIVITRSHKPINTVKLEIPSSSLHNSNTNTAADINVMVIQNEDNDPLLLNNGLATPPTTPVHPNKFTPRKSPRLTQTASSFNPTETLYACGSSRPCTALSARASDNIRYPYGNPYTARVPRIVTTNPLYQASEEPTSSKPCLNADNFLRVHRYDSRTKTPSSYTTSSSKQASPSIRIPYSPVYSEDTCSNQSSGLGYYQRMGKKLLAINNPIRTPPPTANSTAIPIIKSNTSVGSIAIPIIKSNTSVGSIAIPEIQTS